MLAVVALLSIPFLFVLARRPVLRRLAVRNLTRRPREAALVVLGSMFGTAIITGSLVVGDTIESSVRDIAHTRLGPIDEVIVTSESGVHADLLADVRAINSDLVDGTLGFGRLAVAAAAGEGDAVRAAPKASIVEVDFAEARRFGADPEITGIRGETPAPGRAVLTEGLADVLEVERGDPVRAHVYGKTAEFAVDRVVPAQGVAGFTSGFFDNPSHNLLVAPGTLAEITRGVQAQIGRGQFPPPDQVVAVSNQGGVEDGAALTDEVTRRLERVVDPRGLRVVPVKQEVLDEAAENSASFEELFSAMGAFGVLAGILLLVNIFVMLGEERKPELGMLRAVGLRRGSLVGAFSTEGWVYALAAAGIGTFTGLGLGRVIIQLVERIFENDVEGFGFGGLRFAAEAASLERGFAFGFMIALVAITLTSVRISRFNVIRAIRDLPEPRRTRARLRWAAGGALVAAVGAVLTAASAVGDVPPARLVGPVLMVFGFGALLWRWMPHRPLVSGAAVAVLAWAAAVFPLTTGLGEAGIQTFVIQGIVLTAAAVVLVTQEHDRFEALARRLGVGRLAMAMRLGLAYPVARRFRTGLTLAMYSLVIFTLTFISVLSATFSNQTDRTAAEISGGYDVFVRSNPTNPVPFGELTSVDGVTGVAPVATVEVDVEAGAAGERVTWGITGFDERLIEHGAPTLADRGTYPTDEAAYRAVLADPSLVLTDQFFLQEGGGPPERQVGVGDVITVANPRTGESREVTVAAQSADDFLFNGALYGMDGLRDLYGDRAVPNRGYVAVDGRPPTTVAAEISGRYVEQGASADSIRQLLTEFIAVQNQFFRLFQGYLGLGLLVGIAGLGVVMVRAVRERRREIGVLRALGFQSATVRRSFLFESAFIAIEGTLIGAVLALVTAYNVMANTDAFGENAAFSVSPTALALVLLGTLAASLLATAAPTRAAARIRPAVALRIAD